MLSPTSKLACCLICFLSSTRRVQGFVRDKLQWLILLLDLMCLVQWFCFDGFMGFMVLSRLLVFWEIGLLWWVNFLCSNFMGLKLLFFFWIKKLNLLGNQFFACSNLFYSCMRFQIYFWVPILWNNFGGLIFEFFSHLTTKRFVHCVHPCAAKMKKKKKINNLIWLDFRIYLKFF